MIVLRELATRDPATVTIDDCYEGFFSRMGEFIDRKLAHSSQELAVRRRKPSSLLNFGDCSSSSPCSVPSAFRRVPLIIFNCRLFRCLLP